MNWKKLIPTGTEQGEWRGAFSTYAEWHAAGIALSLGAVAAILARPELMAALVFVAIGEAEAQGKQMRDVAKEPVYALVSLVIGYLAVGFGVNPEAIQRLGDLLTLAGAV